MISTGLSENKTVEEDCEENVAEDKNETQIKVNHRDKRMNLDIEFNRKCVIQTTKTGNIDLNKPYVYHAFKEILNYREGLLPKNNNIHIVGIFHFDLSKGHHLDCISKKRSVVLDLKMIGRVPEEKDIVSVFGFVEFRKDIPVFVVRFFRREVEITVKKYIENLKKLRGFIP
ncbi:hypothetical protein NQ318_006492, partial [Aromia moschata]